MCVLVGVPSDSPVSACGSGMEFLFANLARKSEGMVLVRLGVADCSLKLLGVDTLATDCISCAVKFSVTTGGGRLRDDWVAAFRELRRSLSFSGRTSKRPWQECLATARRSKGIATYSKAATAPVCCHTPFCKGSQSVPSFNGIFQDVLARRAVRIFEDEEN